EAARSLNVLLGPEPSGAFRQQVRIIQSSADQLRRIDPQKVAPEPTADAGVRAVYSALAGLQEADFANSPDVAKLIAEVRDRTRDLDTVRGPLHSLVVADALRASANTVDKMASLMETRTANAAPMA